MPPPPNKELLEIEENLRDLEAIKFDAKEDLTNIFKGVSELHDNLKITKLNFSFLGAVEKRSFRTRCAKKAQMR